MVIANPAATHRRHDLDWLRVLAILSVFIFHSSRFFDQDGWHVKNQTTYFGVQVWTGFLVNWMMPLIFVISGASLFYGIDKASAGKFIKDKVQRLFVPLVVGAFTHISFQVYLERLSYGEFRGSYFEFLPHYFEGFYGFGGNFAWMGLHLWYLLMLFVFSLLFFPLLRWMKGAGRSVLNGLSSPLALPGAVYLLALPVILLLNVIDPDSPLGIRAMGGWSPVLYIVFFLSGFVIVSHERLQENVRRLRWLSLVSGLAALVALLLLWARAGDPAFGTPRYALIFSIYGLGSWCWILAILGFGMRRFTFSTPFLRYATEAVLPFYILHQTVLICIGYFVVQWPIPDFLKFLAISTSSLAAILGLYELLVRRSNILRFFFGMKPLAAKPEPQAGKTVLAE